jgi:hypothetical protein
MDDSNFGPYLGSMVGLDDNEKVLAFLRLAKNFFPYKIRQDFSRTVASVRTSLEQQNDLPPVITKKDLGIMFLRNLQKTQESRDDKVMIAKANINPIILLLCSDHGVTADTDYTPMASPRSNSRSLVSEHVESVCRAVLQENSTAFSSEEYAIAPFYVVSASSNETASKEKGADMEDEKENDSGINKKNDENPIEYKCLLNRDRHSHHGDVVEKRADCLSMDRLQSIYSSVSFSVVITGDRCAFIPNFRLWLTSKRRYELRARLGVLRNRTGPVQYRNTFCYHVCGVDTKIFVFG